MKAKSAKKPATATSRASKTGAKKTVATKASAKTVKRTTRLKPEPAKSKTLKPGSKEKENRIERKDKAFGKR